MDRKTKNLDLDTSYVDSEVLVTYPVLDRPALPHELIVVDDVEAVAPFEGDNSSWIAEVEVEYQPEPGGRALDLASFKRYLRTFRHADIHAELMAQTIRNDLMRRLELDDVFVQVNERNCGQKKVRLGEP